jgi:hypothetical protein
VRVLVLLALVACDLQPPKKRVVAQAPADALTASPPREIAAPPETIDAGVQDAAVAVLPPDAMVDPTEECLAIGVRLAQLAIDDMRDPIGKAQLEQERSSTVRKVSQACTAKPWSVEVRACYLKATGRVDAARCGRLLTLDGG